MGDSKHVTYEDAGVDTAEGGRAVDAIKQMVKDTNRSEVIGGIGGFGGLFSAAALKDMEDPILISGTDGVGTKLVLAQIMDRHETVGQDLVAMCVNDILASGAEPLLRASPQATRPRAARRTVRRSPIPATRRRRPS